MIYIIGNKIKSDDSGFWGEGEPYSVENIYSIELDKIPPVNYDVHTFKPHSLTHCESAKHTSNSGKTLDKILSLNPECFVGDCLVIKFKPFYIQISEKLFIHKVTKKELSDRIASLCQLRAIPSKIIITTSNYPTTINGYHDPNYILVLDTEAANYLICLNNFNMFGTTWKSADYNPGHRERPIHDIIFQKAVIY